MFSRSFGLLALFSLQCELVVWLSVMYIRVPSSLLSVVCFTVSSNSPADTVKGTRSRVLLPTQAKTALPLATSTDRCCYGEDLQSNEIHFREFGQVVSPPLLTFFVSLGNKE